MSKEDRKKERKIIVRDKARENRDLFDFGANILNINVKAFIEIYKKTINILREGISQGKTNVPLSLMSFMLYADLLHGGNYACPINLLPHYIEDKEKSPYYAGKLIVQGKALFDYLSEFFQGSSAFETILEVLEDANCPHIFPKLLSDPAYAQLKMAFAQSMTSEFWLKGTTGLKTLVEGVSTVSRGIGEREETTTSKRAVSQKGASEEITSKVAMRGLLALLGSPDLVAIE